MQIKYVFYPFCFSIVSFLLIACNANDSGKKTSEPITMSTEAMDPIDNNINADSIWENCNESLGSIVIKRSVAESLMKHFDTVYRGFGSAKPNLALVDSFWVDSVVVVSMADVLVRYPDYDGIRVHFGTQGDAKKTATIILCPTSPRVSSSSNKGHEDKWSQEIMIPAGANPSFKNFIHSDAANPRNSVDFRILGPMGTSFEKEYRQKPASGGMANRDSLSKAVWFNRCAILILSEFLKTPANRLNGISIYAGAYKDSSTNTNHTQAYLNQSTFIIVPTTFIPGGHTDNWKIIPNSFMKNGKFKIMFDDNGFNHGELCPNSCN